MKSNLKFLFIFICIALMTIHTNAQNGAAINNTGATASPSAMLDVSSTNSGILIPRMTESQKLAISSPATGLMIYQTDGITGFWYYNGTSWVQSIGPVGATGSVGATGYTGPAGPTGATGLLASGSSAGNTPYWDGSQWVVSSSNIYNNGGSVGIGTNSPDASAAIDIYSINKGALIPRMGNFQRNAIPNPANGLQIYNVTTSCIDFFVNGSWQQIACGCTGAPFNVTASASSYSLCTGDNLTLVGNATGATSWSWTGPNGYTSSLQMPVISNITSSGSGIYTLTASNACGSATSVSTSTVTVSGSFPNTPVANAGSGATSTSFTANWSAATGATGYYLDVSTDVNFGSYVSGYYNYIAGNVLSASVTGLVVGTTYYYRVRAMNDCGASNYSNTITISTVWSCGYPLTKTHTTGGGVAPVNKTVTYGTVLTSLSGASKCWITRNLGADNQPASATDATDAAAGWYWQFNRKQGYATGPAPSWTITSIDESSNWLSANDPCTIELGSGWRIPTYTEWLNADGSPQNWSSNSNVYSSVLKLHAGGMMQSGSGSLFARSSGAFYWSGTQYSNTYGWCLETGSSYSDMNYTNSRKAAGHTVRCIKD